MLYLHVSFIFSISVWIGPKSQRRCCCCINSAHFQQGHWIPRCQLCQSLLKWSIHLKCCPFQPPLPATLPKAVELSLFAIIPRLLRCIELKNRGRLQNTLWGCNAIKQGCSPSVLVFIRLKEEVMCAYEKEGRVWALIPSPPCPGKRKC